MKIFEFLNVNPNASLFCRCYREISCVEFKYFSYSGATRSTIEFAYLAIVLSNTEHLLLAKEKGSLLMIFQIIA